MVKTRDEWEGLKELHGKNDEELHNFLLNYLPTQHIALTPNEVRFLAMVLRDYSPDYDEWGIRDSLLSKLGAAQ